MNSRVLHFIGTFVISGIIIGTPFTVQALANNIHQTQNHDKDNKKAADKEKEKQNNKDKENKKEEEKRQKEEEQKKKDEEQKKKEQEDKDKKDQENKNITPTPEPSEEHIKITHGPIIVKQPIFIPVGGSTSNTTYINNNTQNFTQPSGVHVEITNNNNPTQTNSNSITINNNSPHN